jgi:UDP-GlcNAc3NAcA epimerase
MSKAKIISVIGARPQFIKMAMISKELANHDDLEHVIVHTGQHFDENMSRVFFDELEIPRPDYNLQIDSLSHGAMTGRMLEALENVLLDESPDVVIVYGDTNSTLAGALAAKKLRQSVAHVEAGMRSYNIDMPEELNRVLTDRVSDILFCSTEAAVDNLTKEGYDALPCKIVKCGDVMYDASVYYRETSSERCRILKKLDLDDFVLCTVHRAENTDNAENLKSIMDGLNRIAQDITVVMPLHPRTRKAMDAHRIAAELTTIDPVGFFDMIELTRHCRLVITDSGGLQKEAYFFGKGCVTLRDETEWVELVEHGYNILAGSNADRVCEAYGEMISASPEFVDGLYGDGKTSSRIVNELRNTISSRQISR